MRTTLRKAGVACGTAFASIAIALSTAAGGWAANQALVIGGIGAGTMGDLLMAPLLGGSLKTMERTNVEWPAEAGPMTGNNDMTLGASIAIGETNLTAGIATALGKLSRDAQGNVTSGEKVTVVGLSAGSLVVDEVLRNMMADGNLPDPKELTFVVVGDSSRQQLIKDSTYNSRFDYTYHLPPETPYDIVVITGEYDGFADMPDRMWNFLAVANAMAGRKLVHVPVMYTAKLSDLPNLPAKYITVTQNAQGGTTTHYLVPTATLPLVQALPFLKPMEAQLKVKIDKGYKRNDPVQATVATTAALAPAVDETPVAEAGDAATTGDTASAGQAQPEPKVTATAKREERAAARAEAKAARDEAKAARAEARAEAKAAKAEARAQAKADRAAAREARKATRAGGSSDGSGSSDASGSSE